MAEMQKSTFLGFIVPVVLCFRKSIIGLHFVSSGKHLVKIQGKNSEHLMKGSPSSRYLQALHLHCKYVAIYNSHL